MNAARRSRLSTAGVLIALVVGAAGAGGVSLASGTSLAARFGSLPGEPSGQPGMAFPRPAGPTDTTKPSGTRSPAPGAPSTGAPGTTTPPPPGDGRPPAPGTPPSSSRPRLLPSVAVQVLDLVNRERANAGCRPLTEDIRLDTAARRHSADMAMRHYFSHDTPEGTTFDDRERAAGYPRPGAENIAQGYRSADAVMQGWLQSDGHRRNILDCTFTTMGLGLDTRGWFWTQDFGR
jgi:uncharacterized protein YkwD